MYSVITRIHKRNSMDSKKSCGEGLGFLSSSTAWFLRHSKNPSTTEHEQMLMREQSRPRPFEKRGTELRWQSHRPRQHSAKLSWYFYLWGEVNSKLQVFADIQACETTIPWVIMSMWTPFTQKNIEPFNPSCNNFNYKHPYLNLVHPRFPNCLPSSHLSIFILCH